jgi:hypothetical protein
MNDRRMGAVIEHLRRIVRPEQNGELSDGELLQRWTSDTDQAAFELLLLFGGSASFLSGPRRPRR